MTDIQALNAIISQLGGTTTYRYNIQAYNAWSVLQGGTGTYTRDIDALNAIDVLNGGSGGHKYNINALNSIDVAAGGTGGHTRDIAALTSLGALLNQTVSIPAGFVHPMLPDVVIKKSGSVATIENFTINSFRTTYATPIVKYLDQANGLDTNNGDTLATAYKTLAKLVTVTFNRAYVAAGNYFSTSSTNIFTQSREIFGLGSVKPGFMRGTTGEALTWTDLGGGTFRAPTTLNPVVVVDTSQTDAEGDYLKVTAVADATAVAATANTFWKDTTNNLIYVHLTAGTQPANNLCCVTTYVVAAAGMTCYAENIRIHGVSATNATATKTVLLCKDVDFMHCFPSNAFATNGNVWSWTESCKALKTATDGFTYTESGAYNPAAVENNCLTRNNGAAVLGSSNGSTSHGVSIVLRLNGNYTLSEGPTVHDVGNGKSLNICCTAGNSVAVDGLRKVAFAIGGGSGGETCEMYLDSCTNLGAGTGTIGGKNFTPLTAKLYVKNTTLTNVDAGTTLIPY